MTAMPRPIAVGPSRTVLFAVGGFLLLAACALGALIFFRTEPFGLDMWWNSLFVANAAPLLVAFSQVMNFLGAGWFGFFAVPIAGALALVILKRPWSAAFFITAEIASAGLVQILKHLFGRVRPEEIIVISDFGSFPSGHVANAATLATAAFILFPRLIVVLVGAVYVFVMALSRTVLHAHWLSDTLAGAMIGVGVVLIVAGLYAPLLWRERPAAASAREVTAAPQ